MSAECSDCGADLLTSGVCPECSRDDLIETMAAHLLRARAAEYGSVTIGVEIDAALRAYYLFYRNDDAAMALDL